MTNHRDPEPLSSRRDFVKSTAAAAALAASATMLGRELRATPAADPIKVGVIGCGGRGTGAAMDALSASNDVVIWSLGDVFADRLAGCRSNLAEDAELGARAKVPDERCFSGFDSYSKVLASGVDYVILATAPHFRPIHLAAAVRAGKHVFMEKPAAADPAGVRSVIESGEIATQKKLSIVSGTQRRHEACYLEAMRRVHAGEIGKVISARCYWNQGGLWVKEKQPEWSEMEWQVRNWLYFSWLSGDHIVEQHVHNLDVVNWAIGAHPVRAVGMGGRQVRVEPQYGNIFDHFAIDYEYPGGVHVLSMSRQIDGCHSAVEEIVCGTKGTLTTRSGFARIEYADGSKPWQFSGENPNPYVIEHKDLIGAIRGGTPINEARRIAESTLTAILGRMSTYTGKELTWEQALNSKLDLAPHAYALGDNPVDGVAVPGKTAVV